MPRIEDRLDALEQGLGALLEKFLDYKCPECKSDELTYSAYGNSLQCSGCYHSYYVPKIIDSIHYDGKNIKVIKFRPTEDMSEY